MGVSLTLVSVVSQSAFAMGIASFLGRPSRWKAFFHSLASTYTASIPWTARAASMFPMVLCWEAFLRAPLLLTTPGHSR